MQILYLSATPICSLRKIQSITSRDGSATVGILNIRFPGHKVLDLKFPLINTDARSSYLYPGPSQCKLAPGVHGFFAAPPPHNVAPLLGKQNVREPRKNFLDHFFGGDFLEKKSGCRPADSLTKETNIYFILIYFSEIKKSSALLAPLRASSARGKLPPNPPIVTPLFISYETRTQDPRHTRFPTLGSQLNV